MKILDRLPYSAVRTTIAVRGETQRVHAYQIIVWVSLNLQDVTEWDPRVTQFPAILDTGNNHNFSITRSQLLRWAGMQPEALAPLGAIRERGQRVPLHAARIWLRANVSGMTQTEKPQMAEGKPYGMDARGGIALYPDAIGPRLPVLGLRALTDNQLHLTVDGQRQLVWLGTLDWRLKLLRLLY